MNEIKLKQNSTIVRLNNLIQVNNDYNDSIFIIF